MGFVGRVRRAGNLQPTGSVRRCRSRSPALWRWQAVRATFEQSPPGWRRGDAHQHAFFAGRAAAELASGFGLNLNHAIEQAGFQVGGNEARANALNGVGRGRAAEITGDAVGSTANTFKFGQAFSARGRSR